MGDKLKANTAFKSAEDCFRSIGLHVGFISCQVVRKDLWEKIIFQNDLSSFENNWMMVYIIGKMIQHTPRWGYIYRRCIKQRIGNDSFVKGDVFKRELITHVDYGVVIAGLFGRKSEIYKHIFSYLVSDRLPRTFGNLKSKNISLFIKHLFFETNEACLYKALFL